VSHEVLSRLKQMMVQGTSAASHSFLIDDDSGMPFTNEDLAGVGEGRDLLGEMPVPGQLRDLPSFGFLARRLDATAAAAAAQAAAGGGGAAGQAPMALPAGHA
jgi:myosin V